MTSVPLPASGVASEPGAVASSAPPIPFLHHDSAGLEPTGLGAGNALVVVLLVAAVGFWVLRRIAVARRGGAPLSLPQMFGSASARAVAVLESTRLTPKASAHVLQWQGQQWLVICTDQAATVVAQARPDGAPALEGKTP